MELTLIAMAGALFVGWGVWWWLVQSNVSRASGLQAKLDELEQRLSERK